MFFLYSAGREVGGGGGDKRVNWLDGGGCEQFFGWLGGGVARLLGSIKKTGRRPGKFGKF